MPLAPDEEGIARRGGRGIDPFFQVIFRHNVQGIGILDDRDPSAAICQVDMAGSRDR